MKVLTLLIENDLWNMDVALIEREKLFLGFKTFIDDTEISLSHFYVKEYLFDCLKSFACFIVKQYVKLYNIAFFIDMSVP